MAQQIIDVGNVANDGQGDPLRTAFEKTNDNFTELYNIGGISGIANGTSNINIIENSTVSISASNVANVLVVSSTGATLQGTFLANTTISATGNITAGGLFIGNGSQLTGVISSAPAALITGTTLSSNVVNSSLTSVGTLGSLTVTANVTGGNILSGGVVSSTGNVLGTNLLAGGIVQATGNVTGGNLTTAGKISSTGNIDSGGTVTALAFVGNGAGLTGFTVSSNALLLTGTTLSSNVTISSLRDLGNLNSLTVSNALGGSGAVTANSVSAGTVISATGNVTGGNVISLGAVSAVSAAFSADIVSNANVSAVLGNVIANNLISNTAVETNTVSASGNVQAVGYTGTNISVSGNIVANNLSGTLTTAVQTAITSVGTLGSLNVSGNVTGGNINISGGGILTTTGNVIGANFIGNVVGNISGNLSAPGANTQIIFNDNGIANATSGFIFDKTSSSVTVTANVTAGNVISNGTISATANIRGASNIVVDGQFGYFNTTNTAFVDPIVSVGRLANNSALISNDGDDRGAELFYYDTSEKRAFIGYINASNPNPSVPAGKLLAATGVTVSAENVTGIASYGSFVVGTLEGNAVTVGGNVTGGNLVSNAAISGVTFSVSGNVTGGNIISAGIGNIATLEVTTVANVKATTVSTSTTTGALIVAGGVGVVGNVYSGNANVTNTVTTSALSVTGNTATVTTANYQIGYRDLPQNTSFGTLAITDGGKHYYGSGTITIPTNASVALPIGTALMIIASGSTTVSPSGGVTLVQAGTGSTGARTIATYGQASLVKVASDTWYISGVGIT